MTMNDKKTQAEKFKNLAREAGCEDDETAFEDKLRRIAGKPQPPLNEKAKKKKGPAK